MSLKALIVARDHPSLVRSLTLGEPPAMSFLTTSSHGESVFQNFMQNAITPSDNAFKKGEIEEGIRLFIKGAMGVDAYGNLPSIARIFMLENARELMGEMQGISTEGVDFFPAFTCGDAERMTMPVLLLEGEMSPEMFVLINDRLEQCMPDVERVVISEASHDLKIQEPPVLGETVLRFLDQF